MNSNSQFVKNLSKISATLIILSPLADPSFAQSEELRRLTKELLGSAFDNHSSEVALLGVINKNTGRIQRVVENTVDNHSNKLPIFQKQFEKTTSQVVEILIPIKTGMEYSMLQSKYPNIKIQESPGGVAILAGSNTKALPMYLLGKKIQEEFGFGFELAYSDGHPDLNMAWLAPIKSNQVAKKPGLDTKDFSQKSQVASIKPVFSESALDLGKTLSWSAPWTSAKKLSTVTNKIVESRNATSRPNKVTAKIFKSDYKFPPLIAPPSIVESKLANGQTTPLMNTSNKLSTLISSVKITPVKSRNATSRPNKATAKIFKSDYKFPPLIAPPSIVESKLANGQTTPLMNTSNKLSTLISSVKITPVKLKNVAIGSSSMIALNKSLNYVYVEIASDKDLNRLENNIKSVNILRNSNNKLLARVGIFANTSIGNRLKEAKLQELDAKGFNVIAYNAKIA